MKHVIDRVIDAANGVLNLAFATSVLPSATVFWSPTAVPDGLFDVADHRLRGGRRYGPCSSWFLLMQPALHSTAGSKITRGWTAGNEAGRLSFGS